MLDYEKPRPRPIRGPFEMLRMEWLLFAGASALSILSVTGSQVLSETVISNSAGPAAGGMWIALVLLHLDDRRQRRREDRREGQG